MFAGEKKLRSLRFASNSFVGWNRTSELCLRLCMGPKMFEHCVSFREIFNLANWRLSYDWEISRTSRLHLRRCFVVRSTLPGRSKCCFWVYIYLNLRFQRKRYDYVFFCWCFSKIWGVISFALLVVVNKFEQNFLCLLLFWNHLERNSKRVPPPLSNFAEQKFCFRRLINENLENYDKTMTHVLRSLLSWDSAHAKH